MSLLRTTRSISFPINARLDTGLKCFSTLRSRESSFSRGIISASFTPSIFPVDKERLTNCTIVGRNIYPMFSYGSTIRQRNIGEFFVNLHLCL